MLSIGVENFSFEVIEECDRSMLDSREDYWQDFFKAKEFFLAPSKEGAFLFVFSKLKFHWSFVAFFHYALIAIN